MISTKSLANETVLEDEELNAILATVEESSKSSSNRRLTYRNKGFIEQMHRDINFSPEDIDNAVIGQAGLYAYYAEQAMWAQREADNLKLKVKLEEAKLDKTVREQMGLQGIKITEAAVEKEILRHPDYQAVKTQEIDAQATATLLRDTLEAFKQRRDMLIQLGVQRREEMKGTLRIMSGDSAMAERIEAQKETLRREIGKTL
jgi:hypothetical protein